MWETIGELWIQTRITTTFQYYILCILTLTTQKLQVLLRSSISRMSAVLSVKSISVLELYARYDWWIMATNTHCSLFPISHWCLFTCISQKLQIIYGTSAYWMTVLLLKTFLEWLRIAQEVRLDSYSPRNVSIVLWYSIVCVHCKAIHTSWFSTQLPIASKSLTLQLHTTHQTMALPPTMHRLNV